MPPDSDLNTINVLVELFSECAQANGVRALFRIIGGRMRVIFATFAFGRRLRPRHIDLTARDDRVDV